MPKRYKLKGYQAPYLQRSRAAKKAAYIRLANRIRRSDAALGGRFYTRHYLHGQNNWLDLYFMGDRYPVYYNVFMQTTRCAYAEQVLHAAYGQADSLVADKEDWLSGTAKDPETGLFVTPAREPKRFPELGGLSKLEWVQEQLHVLADARTIHVHEHWDLRKDYSWGIGLHVTLDVPYITMEVVNGFIERFLRSSQSYASDQQLTYRYSEIEHWGVDANQIAEPWEWDEQDGAQGRSE